MAKIDRPVIVAGNDTTLYIQLKQFDSGEYIDFDLNQVSDLKVELLCAKDNYKYDIPYTIDSEQTNLIICDLKHNYYHSNTSYGIIVSGTNPDGKYWTWTMMPREGFLVVSNTSGLDLREDAQQLSFNGLVGWGITTEADMTNYYTKNQTNNLLATKQDKLVSGSNIKSINNESILGSGNIDIQIPEQVQANWNETDSSDPSYIKNKPTLFSGDYNDLNNKPDLSNYVTDNELQSELENYVTDSDLVDYVDDTELEQHLVTKQDKLISGSNIKTINNESILGSGNIDIQGGGGDFPEEEFNNINKTIAEALFDHNSKISNLQSKVNNQIDVIEDLKSDTEELDSNISNIEKDINSSNRTIAEVVTNLNNRVEVLEDGGGGEQVQANWDETDTSAPSYIQNKPTIPTTTSELTNDSGFLTSAVESFNGATGVVTYTAPVTSVNGMTGAVTIDAGVTSFNGATGAITYTAPVTSVNGMTGAVTIQAGSDPGFIKVTNGSKVGLVSSLTTIYNTNIGNCAVIEGNGYGSNQSTASGDYSHAEGMGTKALGYAAHAEGYYCNASEQGHAEGHTTTASGQASHAEGRFTNANTTCSHAEGEYTQTRNTYEHASGRYNVSNGGFTSSYPDSRNTLFSVGNGESNSARHNAFEIRQNGDIYLNDGSHPISSTTNGLKIEVVSALPSSPEQNVIYIVTSQNS